MTSLLRWFITFSVLLLLLWGSLFLYYPTAISPLTALDVFVNPNADEIAKITVLDMRLPRSLVAIVMGANIAVAGAILQTITRNPLASPSLLSINSGASLAMVTATAVFPAFFSDFSIAFVASVGGGLSWLLVVLISGGWTSQGNRNRVILAGITVSMFCAAVTKMVIIIAEDQANSILNWLAGGIAQVRWNDFWILLPFFVATILFSLFYAGKLNLLSLSDESAQSLGVDLFKLRWVSNVISLLIVGSAVSVAGPIAFIGLLMPHLGRFIIGYDLRKLLPMTMLLGASLMLIADIVARAVDFPNEIPAGAILALIGAPIFVWFAKGRRS